MPKMFVIFLTVLIDLIGFGIIIPLLPFYAELPQYSASPLQIGLLMAIYSLGQFLFSPLWGALSDRHGRRPILLFSIGMGSLSLAGFAMAQSLWALFLARGLHGVFAANISTAQAYMADITSPENRAKGMGMIGAAFGLGFTFGPWIGGELSTHSYTLPIWVAAAMSAVNFLLALTILPESLDLSKGVPDRKPRPLNPNTIISVMRMPAVGIAITLMFMVTFAFSMMTSSFALYEERLYGLGPQEIGRLMGIIGLIGVVVQGGAIGRLTARFGEEALIRVGVPLIGLGMLGFAFAGPSETSIVFSPLGAVCAFFALVYGITQPNLFSIISRRSPQNSQGLVMGTNHSLSALARTVAPAIALAMFGYISPAAPFIGGACLLVVGSVVARIATRTPKPQTPELGST